MGAFRVCVSPSASERLAFAQDALRAAPPEARVLLVGASRGAADDLARRVALSRPATFGIERLSLTQLAARSAIAGLASSGVVPSTALGADAVATRVVFEAARDGLLEYFGAVSSTPGFPRALSRTLQELRLADIGAPLLSGLPLAGADLAGLLDRFDACLEDTAIVDRAKLFRAAARFLAESPSVAPTVILLDVPIESAADGELVTALVGRAAHAAATIPHGDRETLACVTSIGARIDHRGETPSNDLAHLRRFLFNTDLQPPERTLDGSLEFFSAPGEGRECVEIARRILKEARRGVRFDDMAVLVRSPQRYDGLLEHALKRADVPAWFDRGTRRPHPAGRAFLAILACAAEQLSASRFAEYLSLGQVPTEPAGSIEHASGPTDAGHDRHPTREAWVASTDDVFGSIADIASAGGDAGATRDDDPADDDVGADGGLQAPWRWERILADAAVIGRDADRWRRRLDGHARELRLQVREAVRRDGEDAPRVHAVRRTLDQLERLHAFALPIVDELSRWPAEAVWGAWLDRFVRLVPRVLRHPSHVLRVLADLRPMADVGPVDLNEVRRVLSERLLTLESDPPLQRYGRVFVGTPRQSLGRTFRVAFVPGLAERMFPQRPREDPLLLDDLRDAVPGTLATQKHRLASERLLLQVAIGAASERLYVSYPRIELGEARARVPSFYALDVIRAATGRIPDHELLEERARHAANATLAWPAPLDAREAIDSQEHDLAVLRVLLDEQSAAAVKGHAHYLLRLNECLRRSVIDRWSRGAPRWSVNDGLTRVSPQIAGALGAQRLRARPYSASALQRFSACPYQFVLAAFYRLQPMEHPEALQRMDPLTRGAIFHDIQARFFRALRDANALPVTAGTLDAARRVLFEVAGDVAARAHDALAPAVERVWADEIVSIRRDLAGWLELLPRDGAEWTPIHFELAFGDVPGERDPASVRADVVLPEGFKFRGAIDLVEEHRGANALRVTDHKTGRRPEGIERAVVGGGAVLQPVLYAMAAEIALQRSVGSSRLFYCTAAGGFSSRDVALTDAARSAGLEVLHVVDRAIERGFLAAAPAAGACDRCDFRPVCGRDVFRRVSRKPRGPLGDLDELRSRP